MINPNKLKKFIIRLKTLSPVSLSPRESYCFYKGIDDGKVAFESVYSKSKGINILYPFYQYGEYEQFDPDYAKYYIPGSSLKGSLGGSEEIYVDDIDVKQRNLDLKIVNKLQYAKLDSKSERKAMFKPFFENIGIEMLNPNVEIEATIYSENIKIISDLIDKQKQLTKKQLEKSIGYIKEMIGRAEAKLKEELKGNNQQDIEKWKESIRQLTCFQKKLKLFKEEDVFFLGGYKGEIFSNKEVESTVVDDYQGTFYQDDMGNPFGLVEILSIEENV